MVVKERYSDHRIVRIGERVAWVYPTRIDSHGKFLDDPDYDEIDPYLVCPRCGIQGMAYSNEFKPPLKGRKRRRRAMICLFCHIRTVRGERADFPIPRIDGLPEFNPNDDKIYAKDLEKVSAHDFDD